MKFVWIPLIAACAWAQDPDIATIMSRVAASQAKSQDARKFFVYTQKQILRMNRPNGRLAREEHREYAVTPRERGIRKELARFDGRYADGSKFVSYDRPGYKYKQMDIDGEIIDEMSGSMTNDGNSRDGIAAGLFPLTYHRQLRYDFHLLGSETREGRKVYRIRFEPKAGQHFEGDFDEADGGAWKGEALIDAEEFQPVSVTTSLARQIPLAIRILLGTNIKGLGFSVTYRRFDDGVWFPVSYGGEFELRGLFFYRRTIAVNLVNSDFRRAEVSSNVAYDTGSVK